MSQVQNQSPDLKEIEKRWRASHPRFTDAELLDAFPDGILELNRKVSELQNEVSSLISTIKEVGEPYFDKTNSDSMFMLEFIKHWYITDLLKIEADIRFIERLQKKLKGTYKTKAGELTDADIEYARNVPIINVANLYVNKLRKQGGKHTGCCPFHNDNRPSLIFYLDSNRFHCFGCGMSGDVITFTKEILRVDFKAAIRYLINL